jgi:hypothetical protein
LIPLDEQSQEDATNIREILERDWYILK